MALSTRRAPSSSSLPSSTTASTYDVFLSFRGEDTRTGFTSHLHSALKRTGIIVFKDDKKLEQGRSISEELLKAIKSSQYAIVVISKNFAFSKWCLIELKTIMECRKRGLIVLPIFYHVDPSEVRKQMGIFAQAFAKHRDDPKVDKEHREAWIVALTEVGEIVGCHVTDRVEEAVVLEQIVAKIFCQLHLNLREICKDLVGMESQVEKLVSLLHLGMDDVRFIGIYGISGIGKTTLAYVLYETIRCKFERSCFISCVDEDNKSCSVKELQKQIAENILGESNLKIWNKYERIGGIVKGLRNKKVLIVLDDVNYDQLNGLARDPNWFGQGSRIILTGKNCQLGRQNLNASYQVKPLDDHDALKLFCWKAFNKPKPLKSYEVLSKNIMKLAGGHPLALEVIGSSLCKKRMDVWCSAFEVLKKHSKIEILDKLEISYRGLDDLPKKLFLIIVHFFNGMSEREVLPLLISVGYPIYYFDVLKDQCLIKITWWGEIRIHDLLRKMGQRIMDRESSMELGNGRRLWGDEDNVRILRSDCATKVDEGIVANFHSPKNEQSSSDAFLKATWWTLIMIRKTDCLWIRGNWTWLNALKWCGDPSNLIVTDELRVMELYNSSLKSLLSSWKPHNFVKLNKPYSNIEVLQPRKIFGDLKELKFDGLQDLIKIADFSEIPNLQQLILTNCRDLRQVHLGNLKELVKLHMRGCNSLREIQGFNEIPNLQQLILTDCRDLRLVHLGNLKELVELDMRGCNSLREIQGFNEIPNLRQLIFTNYKDLRKVRLGKFKELAELDMQCCNSLKEIQGFNKIPNFQRLILTDCRDLRHVHASIGNLKRFDGLTLQGCDSLREIQGFNEIPKLRQLSLIDCRDLRQVHLGNLKELVKLDVRGCNSLRETPDFTEIPNLQQLSFVNCRDLRHVHASIGNLKRLEQLVLLGCNSLDETICSYPSWLFKVTSLDLSRNKFMTLWDDIYLLSKLKFLKMNDCSQLRTLPKLPLNLFWVSVRDCPLLEMGYCQTDMRVPHLCNGVWYSVATNASYYDDTPYKILQLNPRHSLNKRHGCYFNHGHMFEDSRPWYFPLSEGMFVWGPTLGFEIPTWFNHRSTNVSGKIQCCVHVDSAELIAGIALFVAYQVHENENLNCSISGNSNPMFPEFAWRLEEPDFCREFSVVFHIPEVPLAGPNGFWALIPGRLFAARRIGSVECHSLKTSIGTSNSDVKVMEYGTRPVHKDDVSEFFNVLSRVTPPGLEFKDLRDFNFEVQTSVPVLTDCDDESDSMDWDW